MKGLISFIAFLLFSNVTLADKFFLPSLCEDEWILGAKKLNNYNDLGKFLEYKTDNLNQLKNKIPRLSPSEIEWLDGELFSSDHNRIKKAESSKEYIFYKLLKITEGLEPALFAAMDSYNTSKDSSSSEFTKNQSKKLVIVNLTIYVRNLVNLHSIFNHSNILARAMKETEIFSLIENVEINNSINVLNHRLQRSCDWAIERILNDVTIRYLSDSRLDM